MTTKRFHPMTGIVLGTILVFLVAYFSAKCAKDYGKFYEENRTMIVLIYCVAVASALGWKLIEEFLPEKLRMEIIAFACLIILAAMALITIAFYGFLGWVAIKCFLWPWLVDLYHCFHCTIDFSAC